MTMNFTDEKKDVLKEIVSIGAGNAATALSQLLDGKVGIEVPDVKIHSIKEAESIFGGPDTIVTTVYLRILGEVSGVILFSFKKENALEFADLLMGKPSGTTKVLNEISQSALKETASILTGAYLGALSKIFNIRLLTSVPNFTQDMAGAIIGDILIETNADADEAIIIDTRFTLSQKSIMTHFFFIPDRNILDIIVDKLVKS